MKNLYLLLFALHVFIYSNAQFTQVPDTNFEQALIDLGIDSDGIINGQVLTSDIETVITLDLFNIWIQDLTGIEDFTSLEYLDVSGCELTILDVSNNVQLKELYCSSSVTYPSMFFTTLDLSNNVNLEVLYGETLVELENLNLKNGNNSILTSVILVCEFEGDPCTLSELICVTVDDEEAATNNEPPYSDWVIEADFVYSEDCNLGIDDVLTTQITLYPNPIQNVLYIENNSGYTFTLKMYDVLGRLVLQDNNPSSQLDVSKLSNGLLFVNIETEEGILTKKIVKY